MARGNNPLTQISSVNQTATALADGGSFTGEWDTVPHEDLLVQVRADTATDIYVDFSHDAGATTHSTLTYAGAANIPTFSRLVKGARHFRVRVENNSGTNQTTLSVHVSCGSFSIGTSPLNLSLSKTSDAVVTRNVPTSADIALGRFGGFTAINKWGHNPDVDTTTDPEDVWAAGGLMNWPTSAAVVSVTSSDAADDGNPIGDGALTFTIEGLDANWDIQTETITLEGASAATTTGTFIRVNRAYVATVGTYHGSNSGNITGTVGGATMLYIPIGAGQTQLARYSVPRNHTLLVDEITVVVGGAKTATVKMWQCPNANDVTDPFGGAKRIVREWNTVAGQVVERLRNPLPFAAYTDVWFEVTEVGANDTAVTATFDGALADVS